MSAKVQWSVIGGHKDHSEFARKVQILIDEGYEPCGGVSAVYHPVMGAVLLYQTFVKPIEQNHEQAER